MRRRHTRKSDPALKGETIQRAIRLPKVQLDAVQSAIEAGLPDIHTLTDATVDALWLWLYEHERTNGHSSAASLAPPPEPAPDETQPDEADHPYTGNQERPKWSDVDLAVLDGDG